MHQLIEQLIREAPVVLDGAWGTELQVRGLKPGDCPDEWNLTHRDRVEAVARSYVAAGSRVILTNTFGASRFMLERHNLADKVVEINHAGAEISKSAAGAQAVVFASIGPSGKMLLMGDVTEDELYAAFLEQAEALSAGGADGIAIETMGDPAELSIAIRAAKSTGLPVSASMVFDSGADKDRTMMGTTPEEAVAAMESAGADIVAANCGQGVEGFLPICRRYRAATDLPIWMKANAGLPKMIGGKVVYTMNSEEFAEQVPALVEAGAGFIGGCCGSNPDFIRAVVERLH